MALCFLLRVAPGSNCRTFWKLTSFVQKTLYPQRHSATYLVSNPFWEVVQEGHPPCLHLKKKKKAGTDLIAVKKLQKSRGPTALVLMFLIFDNITLTGVSACKSEGGPFYRRRWRESLPKTCLGGISQGSPSLPPCPASSSFQSQAAILVVLPRAPGRKVEDILTVWKKKMATRVSC